MTSTIGKIGVKSVLKAAMPVSILVISFWLLSHRLGPDVFKNLPAHLSATPVAVWGLALLFTGISFFSLGRYDAIAHRHLQTGVPMRQARLSGMAGIAIAQTLGFGLLTGAAARWRILPMLSIQQALSISAFVSFSFLAAWIFVTGLVCLVLPAPAWVKVPAGLLTCALPFVFTAMFRWPRLRLRGVTLRLPSLQAGAALLSWTALDTIAASAVLWVLLPEDAGIAFSSFVPVFLLATGFALVSNTPGGVGPFELALVSFLPVLSADTLVQSIIAYRLVYYALPACLGATLLFRPLKRVIPTKREPLSVKHLFDAARSETSVIRQNGGCVAASANGAFAFWPTGQTVTSLFDPISGSLSACLETLRSEAKARDRTPLLYKCSKKHARFARGHGWAVVHLADDAVLNMSSFTVDAPSRRTLRRKLRAARKSGVSVTVSPGNPLELAAIDHAWCAKHGPPRGGTMGRFDPAYVAGQWCAMAYQNNEPVAFVTFFVSRSEWALDLMRQIPKCPDGTMHLLVTEGIQSAQAAKAKTVSLAATPACPNPESAFWRQISKWVVGAAGGSGLRQFKSAFGPTWVPRYAAAPSAAGLALGLADIAREVHYPEPIPNANANAAHDLDENYELDSKKSA